MARRSPGIGRLIGRKRWAEDEALQVVDAWRRSGSSVAAFCVELGISRQRLQRWVSRGGDEEASIPLTIFPLALPVRRTHRRPR